MVRVQNAPHQIPGLFFLLMLFWQSLWSVRNSAELPLFALPLLSLFLQILQLPGGLPPLLSTLPHRFSHFSFLPLKTPCKPSLTSIK